MPPSSHAHTTEDRRRTCPQSLARCRSSRSDHLPYNASEPSSPDHRGRSSCEDRPGQTRGRTTGSHPILTDQWQSHAPRDAPEPDSHFQRTTRPHPPLSKAAAADTA
jgi:hypothetical protein